jgi:LPS-assembly lipoprotein
MAVNIRTLSLLVLLTSLSSCGFSLRGSTTSIDESISVFLTASNPNEVLVERIGSSLQNAGIQVSTDMSANYALHIGEEQFISRPATVNGRARAVQYDLQLAFEYSLERQNTLLIPTETIAANRTHFEDIANISGSSEELTMLREEMRLELVERLLRRIAASANNTTQ